MNKQSFTLMEVMISLFILSSSMFALSELQVRSMLRVWESKEEIDRVYVIKKYLYRMYFASETAKKVSQKFEEPAMQLVIEPFSINQKSMLAPYAKQMHFLEATATWSRGTQTRHLSLLALGPRSQQPAEGQSA